TLHRLEPWWRCLKSAGPASSRDVAQADAVGACGEATRVRLDLVHLLDAPLAPQCAESGGLCLCNAVAEARRARARQRVPEGGALEAAEHAEEGREGGGGDGLGVSGGQRVDEEAEAGQAGVAHKE